MGIWRLIKTVDEAMALKSVLSAPLTVSQAVNRLSGLIGDDSLFDHFIDAEAVNREADIRGLVINRIDQIYFTEVEADELAEHEAAVILKELVSAFEPPANDVFFEIAKIADETEARKLVMWARDDNDGNPTSYAISRDAKGFDFVVEAPDGVLYRVEAIDACVLQYIETYAEAHRQSARRAPSP
jgi:hypothetical protein